MDYCDVFISCLDSHSDGTRSLKMHFSSWQNFGALLLYIQENKQQILIEEEN